MVLVCLEYTFHLQHSRGSLLKIKENLEKKFTYTNKHKKEKRNWHGREYFLSNIMSKSWSRETEQELKDKLLVFKFVGSRLPLISEDDCNRGEG